MQLEISSVESMQNALEAVNYFHDSILERFDVSWNGKALDYHTTLMPTHLEVECVLVSGFPASPTNLQTIPVKCRFFEVTRLLCDFEDAEECDWPISHFKCDVSDAHQRGESARLFALEVYMSYLDNGEWTIKRRVSFLFRTATFTVYDQSEQTEA